jgi:hypothetical protein
MHTRETSTGRPPCGLPTGCQNPDAVAPAAKFRKTTADVEEFLDAIANDQRRADARELVGLMGEITAEPPEVWTSNIVGFGEGSCRSPGGREGVAPLAAFAPRKDTLVVYLVGGYQERYPQLLAQLGPHRTGNSCLYLKRLPDVDVDVLRRLIERSADAQRDMDRVTTRGEQGRRGDGPRSAAPS